MTLRIAQLANFVGPVSGGMGGRGGMGGPGGREQFEAGHVPGARFCGSGAFPSSRDSTKRACTSFA